MFIRLDNKTQKAKLFLDCPPYVKTLYILDGGAGPVMIETDAFNVS
jgi:hypothetical protein